MWSTRLEPPRPPFYASAGVAPDFAHVPSNREDREGAFTAGAAVGAGDGSAAGAAAEAGSPAAAGASAAAEASAAAVATAIAQGETLGRGCAVSGLRAPTASGFL